MEIKITRKIYNGHTFPKIKYVNILHVFKKKDDSFYKEEDKKTDRYSKRNR